MNTGLLFVMNNFHTTILTYTLTCVPLCTGFSLHTNKAQCDSVPRYSLVSISLFWGMLRTSSTYPQCTEGFVGILLLRYCLHISEEWSEYTLMQPASSDTRLDISLIWRREKGRWTFEEEETSNRSSLRGRGGNLPRSLGGPRERGEVGWDQK